MYKYHEPIFNIYTEAFRSKIMEKYSQQKHFTGKIHITKGAFRMSTNFFLGKQLVPTNTELCVLTRSVWRGKWRK